MRRSSSYGVFLFYYHHNNPISNQCHELFCGTGGILHNKKSPARNEASQ